MGNGYQFWSVDPHRIRHSLNMQLEINWEGIKWQVTSWSGISKRSQTSKATREPTTSSAGHRKKSGPRWATTFPKLIYHSIVCIGALVASRTANGYEVQVVGAPHIGQRTEKELIESFVNKIGQLSPQIVTFNGGSFRPAGPSLPGDGPRGLRAGHAQPGLLTIGTPTTTSTSATCCPRSVTGPRSSWTS